MWVSLDDAEEANPAKVAAALGGPSEDWVESREIQRLVALAVAALPDEQREVVVLKEYQGLTFPEIAEIQGVPLSTVKTRLYRGLSVLRERLVRQGLGVNLTQERTYAVPRPS